MQKHQSSERCRTSQAKKERAEKAAEENQKQREQMKHFFLLKPAARVPSHVPPPSLITAHSPPSAHNPPILASLPQITACPIPIQISPL